MNKTKLLSVLLLFVVASCTERIDVKLDESYTRLIIDGSITTDLAPSVVTLTKSSGYFSNAPSPKVTGATVTLFDGTTLYQLTETVPGKSGMYSRIPCLERPERNTPCMLKCRKQFQDIPHTRQRVSLIRWPVSIRLLLLFIPTGGITASGPLISMPRNLGTRRIFICLTGSGMVCQCPIQSRKRS